MQFRNPAPPNLPLPPEQYSRRYHDQHNNVLRLFFSQLVSAVNYLLDRQNYYHNWMSGWDTTVQTAANTTDAFVIKVNTIDPASVGFTLNTDYSVNVPVDGLYIMQFSLQLTNSDSSEYRAYAWIRINGADLAYSRSQVSVHRSHGGDPGAALMTVIYTLPLSEGDTIQLMWAVEDVAISIETLPAETTPPMPASPSVIASIFQVA